MHKHAHTYTYTHVHTHMHIYTHPLPRTMIPCEVITADKRNKLYGEYCTANNE